MRYVFGTHAVKRLAKRHIDVDAVWQIANVGIVVKENDIRTVKQGELDGRRIRVVVEAPNVIVTAFVRKRRSVRRAEQALLAK
ncbi:MAG: DUF4258 domain-containing protein [Bacilli bacterium]